MRCEACGESCEEVCQAPSLPGIRDANGYYRCRWVCESCLPPEVTAFFVIASLPGDAEVLSAHYTLQEATAAMRAGQEVRDGDLLAGDMMPRTAHALYPVVASLIAWPVGQ